MAYKEPVYCFNCDTEAIFYVDWVDWKPYGKDIKRTFMCQTCADAFEFGQSIEEAVEPIENLLD